MSHPFPTVPYTPEGNGGSDYERDRINRVLSNHRFARGMVGSVCPLSLGLRDLRVGASTGSALASDVPRSQPL